MATFYSLVGVTTPFDPSNRFTTSSILPSIALAILRLLLSLYSFVTIFFIYAWQCTHGEARMARRSFSFFTDLTYYGLAFYFFFAGLHTLSYALKGKSWLNGWPKPLQAAHTIFYTTIVCFPPLVTIVFWAILYNDPWFPVQEQAWSNVWISIFNTRNWNRQCWLTKNRFHNMVLILFTHSWRFSWPGQLHHHLFTSPFLSSF